MEIRVFDDLTGKRIEGDFVIYNDELWGQGFGSCNSSTNPTRAWCGEEWKITDPVNVEIIIRQKFNQ